MLHTWSQTLIYHPHVHFIVTGGGLSADGRRWVRARRSFFLPVKALSRLFRGKLLAAVRAAYRSGELVFPGTIAAQATPKAFGRLLDTLYATEWVVYCKPPFRRPQQTLEYLARYTHRVAISNDRIVRSNDAEVTFRYRDSAAGDRIRQMSLAAEEFVRRFLLHILPNRFVRIRHYGLLSTRNRKTKLVRCRYLLGHTPQPGEGERTKLGWEERLLKLIGIDPQVCPTCGERRMRTIRRLQPWAERPPPVTWRQTG